MKTIAENIDNDDGAALSGIATVVCVAQIVGDVARISEVNVREEEEVVAIRGDEGTVDDAVEVIDTA